ncbi:MAG: T9SS type A sorting domain-containing protein [Bacteroidota bacterium]
MKIIGLSIGFFLLTCCYLNAQIAKPDAVCTSAATFAADRVTVTWRLGTFPYVLPNTVDSEIQEKEDTFSSEALEENQQLENVIHTFPNPSNGLVNIDFSNEAIEDVDLIIADSRGRIVWRDTDLLPFGIQPINLSALGLENGMYYLTLIRENHVISFSKINLIKND